MGSPKALLPWEGRPLIQHQLAVIDQFPFSNVVVVLGADELAIGQHMIPDPVLHLAYNPHHLKGRSSSVGLGAHILRGSDAIVILNIDQPMNVSLFIDLLEGAAAHPTAPIIIPVYKGKRGHPILVRRALFSELLHLDEKSEGLKAVVRRWQGSIQTIKTQDPNAVLTFNTPHEYRSSLSIKNERNSI
jgi:molybdenum cofactor cytidylyltransferase